MAFKSKSSQARRSRYEAFWMYGYDYPFAHMRARVLEQTDFIMKFPASHVMSPAMIHWNHENGIGG